MRSSKVASLIICPSPVESQKYFWPLQRPMTSTTIAF
jgi:hypothetical protein